MPRRSGRRLCGTARCKRNGPCKSQHHRDPCAALGRDAFLLLTVVSRVIDHPPPQRKCYHQWYKLSLRRNSINTIPMPRPLFQDVFLLTQWLSCFIDSRHWGSLRIYMAKCSFAFMAYHSTNCCRCECSYWHTWKNDLTLWCYYKSTV